MDVVFEGKKTIFNYFFYRALWHQDVLQHCQKKGLERVTFLLNIKNSSHMAQSCHETGP